MEKMMKLVRCRIPTSGSGNYRYRRQQLFSQQCNDKYHNSSRNHHTSIFATIGNNKHSTTNTNNNNNMGLVVVQQQQQQQQQQQLCSRKTQRWISSSSSSWSSGTKLPFYTTRCSFSTSSSSSSIHEEEEETTSTGGTGRNDNDNDNDDDNDEMSNYSTNYEEDITASQYYLLPILPKPSISSMPQPIDPIQYSGKTMFDRLKEKHTIYGEYYRLFRAEEFFQAATRQAFDPVWYGPGRIKNDFRSKHALLTMHIWFLHKRLISDDIDSSLALSIQDELFHILWDDTTCRIRKEGVNELTVSKYLSQVHLYTFHHLTQYDIIYTEYLNQPRKRLQELRKLVAEHIFRNNPDGIEYRTNHLDRIAWYIDCNYQNIMMHLPYDCYKDGRIAWTSIPDFTNIKERNGTVLPPVPTESELSPPPLPVNEQELKKLKKKNGETVRPDDYNMDDGLLQLPDGWLRNITNSGVIYYWNPTIMESSWDRPVEQTKPSVTVVEKEKEKDDVETTTKSVNTATSSLSKSATATTTTTSSTNSSNTTNTTPQP